MSATNSGMYDEETLNRAVPTNYRLVGITDRGDLTMEHKHLNEVLGTTAEKMEKGHFHDSDRGLIERSFCVRPDLCHRVLNRMEYCEALKEHIEENWGREVRDKDVYEMAGVLREGGHLDGFISDMKRDEYGWSEEDGFASNDERLYAVDGIEN